ALRNHEQRAADKVKLCKRSAFDMVGRGDRATQLGTRAISMLCGAAGLRAGWLLSSVIARFLLKRRTGPALGSRCLAAVLAWLRVLQTGVWSQEPSIAVDVKVVNLPVTVRDKHGTIVQNLSKDDFVLQEDGRPQTIKYFSRESNLPLTLGLLVDTSLSQRRVLGEERSASYSFLDKMLRAKDQAFVIHFDHEAELLQDLTTSTEKVRAALDKLETLERPALSRGGGSGGPGQSGGGWPGSRGGGGGRGGRHGGGGAGTVLYDATYLASDELMKPQSGRKA